MWTVLNLWPQTNTYTLYTAYCACNKVEQDYTLFNDVNNIFISRGDNNNNDIHKYSGLPNIC